MNLKEIEFKLMFKTLFIIILITALLVFIIPIFTSLYDKFIQGPYSKYIEEPFEENNPWSRYVDENNYTISRDYYIENGEFQLSKDYLDNFFCRSLNFSSEFVKFFDKKAEKHYNKLVSSQKLSKEDEKEFLVYSIAVPNKLKEIFDDIDDPDHKEGIIQYCFRIL